MVLVALVGIALAARESAGVRWLIWRPAGFYSWLQAHIDLEARQTQDTGAAAARPLSVLLRDSGVGAM